MYTQKLWLLVFRTRNEPSWIRSRAQLIQYPVSDSGKPGTFQKPMSQKRYFSPFIASIFGIQKCIIVNMSCANMVCTNKTECFLLCSTTVCHDIWTRKLWFNCTLLTRISDNVWSFQTFFKHHDKLRFNQHLTGHAIWGKKGENSRGILWVHLLLYGFFPIQWSMLVWIVWLSVLNATVLSVKYTV